MNAETNIVPFDVPGSSRQLYFERGEGGRLVRLWSAERVYVAEDGGGERVYGSGLARVREVMLPNGMLRHVRSGEQSWMEEYLWDDVGRPMRIDGVEVTRDAKNRIIACRDGDGGEWRYGYAGDDLAVIDSPHGLRQVTRGVDGRPIATRNGAGPEPIGYSDDGARDDVAPLPDGWHRDELGRLWTICNGDGAVETTFLWDGFACIARIDGDVGAPLAAVFSLDASSTPVRVITAAEVTRIPRDAFGESLLGRPRVPGLYGGAAYRGFFHLRSRAVDPGSGAFDRRDPWHGRDDDPRRAEGFRGPLLIENPDCGPYAVCQYDPVGRTDPTGESSIGLFFLDITWALQHNVAGWFGLDWTIAFWSSFFGGLGQAIVGIFTDTGRNLLGRWFDFEGVLNSRTGAYAMRRGFWGVDRAFTYQHIMVCSEESFNSRDNINVINPKTSFSPTLYGTMLRVDFDGHAHLLRGNGDANLTGWTRCGEAAARVAPGSDTPRFPSGGLHLDNTWTDVFAKKDPKPCTVTELAPSGAPTTATVGATTLLASIPAGVTLNPKDVVLLTDAAGVVDIKTVNAVAPPSIFNLIQVTFVEPGLTASTRPVRLRRLGAPSAPDTRSSSPAPAGRLNTSGAGVPGYAKNDALQLSQTGAVVGAALILDFEAQIVLDGALPSPAFASGVEIRTAAAGGSNGPVTLTGNVLSGAPLPAKDDLIVLTGAGQKRGALVIDATGTLDRVPPDLAALGASVTWQKLTPGAITGTASVVTAGSTALTYNPQAVNTAPAANTFVALRDGNAPNTLTARVVTALGYDAIVLGAALPGNAANPYQIVRFPIQVPGPDVPNVLISSATQLEIKAGTNLTGSTLQFTVLPGTTLAALPSVASATNAAGVITSASIGALAPSQFVVIQDTTAAPKLEVNVVTRITATLTLDRSIAFAAGSALDAMALGASGPIYNATFVDATHIVVLPTIGANVPTQMPRFDPGNIVQVIANLPGPPPSTSTQQFIVKRVAGTTLEVTEPPTPPTTVPPTPAGIPAGATSYTAQLFAPVAAPAPNNGTWRIGFRGKPIFPAGKTETNSVSVDLWSGAHVANGTVIALVETPSGGTPVTHVAVINAAPAFDIGFVAPPAATGAINITFMPPGTTSRYATKFAVSGIDLQVTDLEPLPPPATPPPPPFPPAGPSLIAVVPYGPPTPAIVAAGAEMSSGTVLIPDDLDYSELDRKKSLVFHETTHTRQAAYWGPLFMGYLPIFVLDGVLSAATDVELPQFSPYVVAAIEQDGTSWFLRIDNPQDVTFNTGDTVQIAAAAGGPVSGVTSIVLGTKDEEKKRFFFIKTGNALGPGAVQVRKQNTSIGKTLGKYAYDPLHVLTLGGVLNLVAGTIWGGLFRGIAEIGHAFWHRTLGKGTAYDATVRDKKTITVLKSDGIAAVQGFKRVFLKDANSSELYDVESIVNDTITLKKETALSGAITVRPYDTDTIDGLDYFDAAVTEIARPAQITIAQKDGKPSLKPFDRVVVAAGATTQRFNVTNVNGAVVDLDEVPPTFGPNRSLRIAKVDEKDPLGNWDSYFEEKFGMGWMRWLFDFYGQLQYDVDAKRGGVWDWISRIGRYAFSSSSWSAAVPGHLFLDDLCNQRGGKGHLSSMEQEASQESGNTYSPIGRLAGDVFSKSGFGAYKAKVGEVAQYWHTPEWTAGNTHGLQNGGQLDSPGVGLDNTVIVSVPLATVPVAPTAALNAGAASAPATAAGSPPAEALPNVFFPKGAVPSAVTTGARTPPGFNPNLRGMIPTSATLEMSLGAYVAFAQPGTHRLTFRDNIAANVDARESHDAQSQEIFFDVTVSDLNVQVDGVALPQTTPPTAITRLAGQRAVFTIADASGGETWALTMTQPGVVVDVDSTNPTVTALVADGPGSDTVELSRVYTPAGYAGTPLAKRGVHLPADLHIPIRSLRVTVVNTFQLVNAAALNAPAITAPTPATTAFTLIPATIVVGLAVTPGSVTYPPGTPAPLTEPKPVITPIATPPELTAFIDRGQVYKIDFAATDPPEAVATVVFNATVGPKAAPISATVQYTPAFQLNDAGGTFSVARGGPALTLNSGTTPLASAALATADPNVTVALNPGNLTINVTATAAAASGPRRIVAVGSGAGAPQAFRTIRVT